MYTLQTNGNTLEVDETPTVDHHFRKQTYFFSGSWASFQDSWDPPNMGKSRSQVRGNSICGTQISKNFPPGASVTSLDHAVRIAAPHSFFSAPFPTHFLTCILPIITNMTSRARLYFKIFFYINIYLSNLAIFFSQGF